MSALWSCELSLSFFDFFVSLLASSPLCPQWETALCECEGWVWWSRLRYEKFSLHMVVSKDTDVRCGAFEHRYTGSWCNNFLCICDLCLHLAFPLNSYFFLCVFNYRRVTPITAGWYFPLLFHPSATFTFSLFTLCLVFFFIFSLLIEMCFYFIIVQCRMMQFMSQPCDPYSL